MRKENLLEHWEGLPDAGKLKPRPIRYKHKGSTYGHDGVRIEGSPEFIDAILSRLKDLLECENADTRLAVAYGKVEAKPGKDHSGGDYVCYVKVHERGPEARRVNHVFGISKRRK